MALTDSLETYLDDATPERVRQAKAAGLGAPVIDLYLPSGIPSGVKRRKIETPFEAAFRYRWVSFEEMEAGQRFLLHYEKSHPGHGFAAQRWEIRVDGIGKGFEGWVALDHLKACHHALLVIPWKWRTPFYEWVRDMSEGDTSCAALGERLCTFGHYEGKKGAAVAGLSLILNNLAEHFGFKSKQSAWDTRRQLEELLGGNSSRQKGASFRHT